VNEVLEVLFAESGTLGARVQQVERFILPRTIITVPVTVKDSTFNVRVKVARDSPMGRISSIKPEFEDIKMIAERSNMSVKLALDLVTSQVLRKINQE
jgi:uncharacterized protein (DUF111 family)